MKRKLALPMGGTALAAAILMEALFASHARADIAVFDSGRILKIEAASWSEGRITLRLEGGGELVVPDEKVVRVLEDEVLSPEPKETPPTTPYDSLIQSLAQKHGVETALVRAVVRIESNFNPAAVSHAGAMGLMQLMPKTARQYAVKNPFDPAANLDAGIRHMAFLIEKYPSLEHALAAYNAGEAAVARYGGIPPFRETRRYVRLVLDFYALFSKGTPTLTLSAGGA